MVDEIKWLNCQSDSLRKLCSDILGSKYKLSDIAMVEMQIDTCIKQIIDMIHELPIPKNHIICPKCGGERFSICEYGVWDAEPVWDKTKRKWILSATGMSDSGVDLIECKECIRKSSSEDLTGNFIYEVEFNG